MAPEKRNIDASSASPVEETQPTKKVCLNKCAQTKTKKETKKPSAIITTSAVSGEASPRLGKKFGSFVKKCEEIVAQPTSAPTAQQEEAKPVAEPITGDKRKAGDVASEQPDSKRSRPSSPVPETPSSPTPSSEEGVQKKKKKRRSNMKRKNRNQFTSADEALLEQITAGTVPEGTNVPDRVRRSIPDVSIRIVHNERVGDHKWDAQEELSFQRGGIEAKKVGDRPLPIYHAIANAGYSDELIERMMKAYISVHEGAVDGIWGKRAHSETYPPPLWWAIIHGRQGVVQMLFKLGARHDKVRFGNLEHLQGREPFTMPCKWEHVGHERCSPLWARRCCDMYNYLAWSIDRLLESRPAGVHADFDARMNAVETCMMWVQETHSDWMPSYDSSGTAGRTFFVEPLINAGFFRLLRRLEVRDGMSAVTAPKLLDHYVRDIAWSRKTEDALAWFKDLPPGRNARIDSRDFQGMLEQFAVRLADPRPGDELVKGEGDLANAYARVDAILAAWEARIPRPGELDESSAAASFQTYRGWAAELVAVDSTFWKWLAQFAQFAPPKFGALAKNANAIMHWQKLVTEWAESQTPIDTKKEDNTTGKQKTDGDTKATTCAAPIS
ncbi:hypothetical protein PG993_002666 [Apiospora rasikravindrae]|uniref:Ankyrin repeat protein n=1 Tax=Apiospora rasikravindrae TaxID=990691 RepID=A0ABR1TXA3_9PEZI